MPGTLTAIVGPNGAGKTTWFNLLSGQLRPSSGQVLYQGTDITRTRPPARARMGIGRAFQLTQLFARLTVHENIRLAAQAQAGIGRQLWSRWSRWSKPDRRGRPDPRATIALSGRRDDARRPRCRMATSASSKSRC